MKKENNNTNINTNIKNQEEKVMNKMNENMDADVKIELEECKRYAICRIEAWYNSCHRYIEELSARAEREEGANGGALTQMLEECYVFVNHNGHYGDNDEYAIRDIIVDYLKKCPLIWFRPYIEETDLSYDYDLFDMMTSAYHESTVENDNNEENSTTEEEKEMKKEMIIDMVESTYDIVGAARTINNYTGISDDEIEADYVEYIVRRLFSDDEMQEQRNKERLIEYYEKQPEIFFDDFDSEDLVIRMAEDLAKIQYDDLIKRYGFKELSYAPYNPELAASEANYNREMSLELAGTKCEIVESMPELEDVVKSKKISDKNFCRLINMYKKCGFKDWKDRVILPSYVAYDAARCHDQDWLVDYVIDKSDIRGE